MKITAPVRSPEEVDMLLHCGADELYCGVATPEWEAHFGGQWWMNRRSPQAANLKSWEALSRVVSRAHEAAVKVSLVLNAPFYPRGSRGYLLKLSEKVVKELSMDGLIVSDLPLLVALHGEALPVRLHVSSLGGCFNSHTVDFYQSLGACRIILPRQLTLREMERLVRSRASRMEFEVFALNDGCYFEEGFCQTSHAMGPFCLTDWKAVPVPEGEAADIPSEEEMREKTELLRRHLWIQNNCGSTSQPSGLPNGPCSLCQFPRFRDWGVAAVKIVGREASFQRKMASLQLVKAVMDETRAGASTEAAARLARGLRGTPELCDGGAMCYFKEGE